MYACYYTPLPRRLLPDYDKPPNPYTVGETFKIYRHTPPPPFGENYPREFCPEADIGPYQVTQLQWCRLKPPQPGKTSKRHPRYMTITGMLRSGDNCGAQLVIVTGNRVAKIYDPLYYESIHPPNGRFDVVQLADADYSREAAAYEKMSQFEPCRRIVPSYHGSWTFDVYQLRNDGLIVIRPIRMILLGHVSDGVRLSKLRVEDFSQSQRSAISIRAIDAVATLLHHGVSHHDIHPSNILYRPDSHSIVLIDFGESLVLEQVAAQSTAEQGKLPVSPIRFLWPADIEEFFPPGWVGKDHRKWLWEHFGGSQKYQPVCRGNESFPYHRVLKGLMQRIMEEG